MKNKFSQTDGILSREKTRKLTLSALLVSVAIIFGYIEHLIPFDLGIPGIKLGLANITVITVLYLLGAKEAFIVSLLRIFICFLLFGSIYSLTYSLLGGLMSLAAMLFMKKLNKFSIVGVSILGGIIHNIGQLIVAVMLVKSLSISLYLPILLIAGALTGATVGVVSVIVIDKIKKIS